jgi:hypothetical protein
VWSNPCEFESRHPHFDKDKSIKTKKSSDRYSFFCGKNITAIVLAIAFFSHQRSLHPISSLGDRQ